MSPTQRSDSGRVTTSTDAAAPATPIVPAWVDVSTRIRTNATHRAMAAAISRPLGLTTELRNRAMGVVARAAPISSGRRYRDRAAIVNVAARKQQAITARTNRIMRTPRADGNTRPGRPTRA